MIVKNPLVAARALGSGVLVLMHSPHHPEEQHDEEQRRILHELLKKSYSKRRGSIKWGRGVECSTDF